MKRIFLYLTFLFVLFFPVTSNAYIGLCCGKCGGNMPMTIPGGGVPETYEFRFKFQPMFMRMEGLKNGTGSVSREDLLGKFMAVQDGMDMYMTNLAIGYSFTDDLFGGLMFMWRKNDMDMRFNSMMRMSTGMNGYTMKSEGMGDTMLMAKYRLYTDDPLIPTSQFSLFFGLTLPTGSIGEKNSNHPLSVRKGEQLPYSMQLGSGTFDPTVGILYQGSSSPLWWGLNLTYTDRFYDNPRDYRLGNEFKLDLYGMYQARYDTVLELLLNGASWGGIHGEMDEAVTGTSGRKVHGDPSSAYMTPLWNTDNYGGSKVSVTLGIQWQPYPFNIIELAAGAPLYQDLNGPQLKEEYRVMFTWYIEIPTPGSIRYAGKTIKSRLGF